MLEQIQVKVMGKDYYNGFYDEINEDEILRIGDFQSNRILAHQAEETFSNGLAGHTGNEDKEPSQEQKAGADHHTGVPEQHPSQEHNERSQDRDWEIATAKPQYPDYVKYRQQYAKLADISRQPAHYFAGAEGFGP